MHCRRKRRSGWMAVVLMAKQNVFIPGSTLMFIDLLGIFKRAYHKTMEVVHYMKVLSLFTVFVNV